MASIKLVRQRKKVHNCLCCSLPNWAPDFFYCPAAGLCQPEPCLSSLSHLESISLQQGFLSASNTFPILSPLSFMSISQT